MACGGPASIEAIDGEQSLIGLSVERVEAHLAHCIDYERTAANCETASKPTSNPILHPMRYYLKAPEHQAITGPFELDEIKAKLQAGELAAGTLAAGDTGKGLAQIQNAPPEEWVPVEAIPALSGEQPSASQLAPPPPPPIPLQNEVNFSLPTSSAMAFCPACGHKLASDAGSVCDRCGKELSVYRQELARSQDNKPDQLLPKAVVSAGGGCLSVIGVTLMVLGILFLIGFLLLLNLMSKCKA